MVAELLLYAEGIKPAVQETAARVSGEVTVGVSPSLVPALAEHLTSGLHLLTSEAALRPSPVPAPESACSALAALHSVDEPLD